MNKRTNLLFHVLSLLCVLLFSNCQEQQQNEELNDPEKIVGEHIATLTDAPNVPPPDPYKEPQKVIVNLEVIEKVMRLADGVDYTFWTFGGRVPGKFIRVRVGDLIEFHLSNNSKNKMPHNIDLHAVNGPGGGAEASLTVPGHSSQFSFKVLNPGLFVYHCATAPVGMHIANGMYGLILVEPREGLPKVDKEFYVMQGDFYTKGKFGEPGLQAFDMDKAIKEEPDYVLFNGSVGANTGDNAMQVKVGETVRLYVGNGGPNLTSSFHVIGEIFDKVYAEGGTLINNNIQTTLIPPGGSAIVEFKCETPGMLNIVDHSIFRTFNKGALAQIKVSGESDKDIYSGKQADEIYFPEAKTEPAQSLTADKKPEVNPIRSRDERIGLGRNLFVTNCSPCHMKDGKGIPGCYPPLAGSDFLKSRKDKGIGVVLKGLSGNLTVNGQTFHGIMPVLQLSDDDIANILTYVRNALCDCGDMVSCEEVKKIRNGK